jgi:Tol biopolymer transport system component/DNA-binding winged helix-turn-helix (wHTH) protein
MPPVEGGPLYCPGPSSGARMSLHSPPPTSSRASAGAPASRELLIAGRLVQPALNRIAGPEPQASVQVEPKAMEVLLCLAAAPGEVVSREELIDKVWQGAFVSDDVLTRSIGQLRRAFGDDPERPRVIETIRKRGYRLVAIPAPGTVPPAAPAPGPIAVPPAKAERTAAPPSGRVAWRVGGLALGVLALVALALRMLEPPPDRPAAGRAVRSGVRLLPIAAVPADAVRPAVSPDGTRVAFAWNGGAGRDLRLYVALLGAGPPMAVTSHRGLSGEAAADLDPSWSPDGTLVAFSRQRRGSCELLAVPALGGPERSLGGCGNDDATKVSWSPDGRWLATSVRPAAGAAAPGQRTARLRLVSPASRASRDLTAPPPGIYGDYGPAFSPDGTRLAFVRALASDVEDIYVVAISPPGGAAAGGVAEGRASVGGTSASEDAAGGAAPGIAGDPRGVPAWPRAGTQAEPMRVTFDNAAIAGVDWLPDGKELVFASDRGGIYSLWRVPAAGGTPRLLAGSGTKIKHPSAARQRDVVVFESWLYDIGLWRVPLAAAGGRPPPPPAAALEPAAREWSFQPQFSPDGRRIAFGSTRSGTYELWVADADGAHPAQLTSFGGAHLGTPRWSPDGRRIAFTAWRDGRAGVYLVDAAGGAPSALAASSADPAGEVAPAWSRDGRALYFASRRSGSWQVWRLQLASGTAVQVTTGGGYAAEESPDGRELLYSRIDRPGIWRRPLSGAAGESVAAAGLAPGDWGSWTATGDGIYYLDRATDPPVVQLLRAGARRPVQVAALPDLAWSGFALSPDRRSLLYARAGRRECDIVRIENP